MTAFCIFACNSVLHSIIAFVCIRYISSFIDLILSDVKPVHKDAFKGAETILSCEVTGLSAKAKVVWEKKSETVSGSVDGDLKVNTQISTLTVSEPEEDAEYTCIVTSGKFSNSVASKTAVMLDVYCK
jgi:hypothetical protein